MQIVFAHRRESRRIHVCALRARGGILPRGGHSVPPDRTCCSPGWQRLGGSGSSGALAPLLKSDESPSACSAEVVGWGARGSKREEGGGAGGAPQRRLARRRYSRSGVWVWALKEQAGRPGQPSGPPADTTWGRGALRGASAARVPGRPGPRTEVLITLPFGSATATGIPAKAPSHVGKSAGTRASRLPSGQG